MVDTKGNLLVIAAVLVAATSAYSAPAAMGEPSQAGSGGPLEGQRLPARTLECDLGRITNFDPAKNQSVSDYKYEGRYYLKIFLPPNAVSTAPPPEATQPPEPVDPRTRVISDPSGLLKESVSGFDRVVDLWPQRVEMTAPISNIAVNLIVIDQIDERRKTAGLFLTKANDAVTFDHDNLYSGMCRVLLESAPMNVAIDSQ